MHTTRRQVTMAMAAALGLPLAACGRSETGNAPGHTEPPKSVAEGKAKGQLTVWAMGTEGEKLPELMKDFQAANPEVKVDVTPIPWASAKEKFSTAIASQQTPDAAMVGTTWMGEFASQKALDPTPASFDKSAFFPGAQKTTEVNGTSYGIPWYVETRVFYYRKDLAQKAGISSAPTDWAGLQAMAKAMKDKAGAKFGINLKPGGEGTWQAVLPLAWSNGAEIISGDGKTWTWDTPELAEAVKYWQQFFTDGLANKGAQANEQAEPLFVDGSIPMMMTGPFAITNLKKAGGAGFDDKYELFPMPKKKSATSFVGGSDFVVFKNTKNRDSAWKLVEFLAKPETQAKWYQIASALPSVKAAWKDPALANDKKVAVFGKQLEDAKAPPTSTAWSQVVDAFDKEMEQVAKTGADPAKALKAVQSKAASIGTGG